MFSSKKKLTFFLKKWWGTWFDSKEITRHFIFSEEIVRQTGSVHNKHATHVFSSVKKSSSSSLSLQNTMKHLIISSEKNEHIHFSTEKNKALHYFFRKKWSTSLSLPKKIKRLIILFFCREITTHLIFSKEIMRRLIFCWRYKGISFFSEAIMRQFFFLKK